MASTPARHLHNEVVARFKNEERRAKIIRLWASGSYTINQIVNKLQEEGVPCHHGIVTQAVREAEEGWKTRNRVKLDRHKTLELGKLDMVEAAIASDFNLQKMSAKEYADAMMKVAERRAKLLGLDAPQKIKMKVDGEVNHNHVHTVVALSDEELMRIAAGEIEEKEKVEVLPPQKEIPGLLPENVVADKEPSDE